MLTDTVMDKVMFQFHNGAIKRLKIDAPVFIFCEFQFHNGAIKSTQMLLFTFSNFKFQFHNGAIKSLLFKAV